MTSNIFVPMYIYFFAWPWVKSLIWGPPAIENGPPTEEEWAKIDPDLFENSWQYTILKYIVMAFCLGIVMLLMIYVGQEKLLYVP